VVKVYLALPVTWTTCTAVVTCVITWLTGHS